MMKKIVLIILTALTLLAVVGCTQTVSAEEQKSSKPRETTPAVSPTDSAALVNGNTTFGLNLYQLLKETDGNLFYSPYSISEALAMTYAGARGEPAKQMAAALQFLRSQEKLHAAFNNLDLELAKRGKGAEGTNGEGFKLKVVNALWGQNGFTFKNEYLDLLAVNYGAGMRIVDYINAAEEARQKINLWVSDQTANKIKDLLPQGSVNTLTRLVLTNAIYFNAAWAAKFDKDSTQDGQFHLLNGSTITVPMMKKFMGRFNYTEGAGYQAVELPYDGNELSMIVILPSADQFKTFEAALNAQQLNTILSGLKSDHVDLTLPKFKVESQFGLKEALSKLGMYDAFSSSKADFSGMDGNKDLFVTDVVHKAYVSVDENGTEAAAATGVIVGQTSMPMDIKTMTIDRPFIFLIQDKATGAVLFMGRVMNPAS